MKTVIRTHLPRRRVEAYVRSLPGILAGRLPDSFGLARSVQLRTGTMALSLIKEAFVIKARGGTDAAGDKWDPLAFSTIERRLRKKGISLSKAIQNLKRARVAAAKSGGGQSRIHKARLRAEKVFAAATSIEILRDTGVLLNSLSPAVDGPSAPGQILRPGRGEIGVGTNVPYAHYHHEGTSRIPQRRLWPEPQRWPSSWWGQLGTATITGIFRGCQLAVEGGQIP